MKLISLLVALSALFFNQNQMAWESRGLELNLVEHKFYHVRIFCGDGPAEVYINLPSMPIDKRFSVHVYNDKFSGAEYYAHLSPQKEQIFAKLDNGHAKKFVDFLSGTNNFFEYRYSTKEALRIVRLTLPINSQEIMAEKTKKCR